MTRYVHMFDRLLNLISIVLLSGIVISAILGGRSKVISETHDSPAVGSEVSLNQVDWGARSMTVVFVLSSHCAFCERSADFHRAIVDRASGAMHLMAVFNPRTDTVESARSYLAGHQIKLTDIRVTSLEAVGSEGTPTIVFVDQTGHVSRSWTGELTPGRQGEVVSFIDSRRPGSLTPAGSIRRLLSSGRW